MLFFASVVRFAKSPISETSSFTSFRAETRSVLTVVSRFARFPIASALSSACPSTSFRAETRSVFAVVVRFASVPIASVLSSVCASTSLIAETMLFFASVVRFAKSPTAELPEFTSLIAETRSVLTVVSNKFRFPIASVFSSTIGVSGSSS